MINLQEVAIRTKFFAKVSSLGKDSSGRPRYVIILPKEQADEGQEMKGKMFKVTLEEMSLQNNDDNDDHKKGHPKE